MIRDLSSKSAILYLLVASIVFAIAFTFRPTPFGRSLGFGPYRARFKRVLELDHTDITRRHVEATCMIDARVQVEILGVEVPCTCISTDHLPTRIERGQSQQIQFHVDTAQLQLVKNEVAEIPIKFLANRYKPVIATLRIVSRVAME